MSVKRKWPENCVWPEPIWDGDGDFWELEMAEMQELDEDGEDLKEIKEYMDELVEEGRLLPDYSLNPDYHIWDNGENDEDGGEDPENENEDKEFRPEKGIDYWDDGFDLDTWLDDLSHHINLLKINACNPLEDPIIAIREALHYDFINENLARQAFTRRAFAEEFGLTGDSEELEFYGDSVLNMIVTREMFKKFSDVNTIKVDAPYRSAFREGDLSKVRARFVQKEHLNSRVAELGLDRFILFGSSEMPNESAREDMMEALIGAVAVDSGWNWDVLEDVVDRLINLQLDKPDQFIKKSCYEMLNSWHQRRFGCIPTYEVDRSFRKESTTLYVCLLRFQVPENDKGIWTSQRVEAEELTRSEARERAAEEAIRFIKQNGLWIRLTDAGMEPDLENSINQLQELYQKKYVNEAPVYQFGEFGKQWQCDCGCDGFEGFGRATGKTKAKKKAAYMLLVRLFKSAGIANEEWDRVMWESLP